MYSVPRREREREGGVNITEPPHVSPYRGRDCLYGNGVERSTYLKGCLARPISVTASIGSYVVIHSEVIMRAIHHCVKVYPGISKAAEFMCFPASYALVVYYRDELQAYSDGIPGEVETRQVELCSPTTGGNDDRIHFQPNQHIPLLLRHVFSAEFTATYD